MLMLALLCLASALAGFLLGFTALAVRVRTEYEARMVLRRYEARKPLEIAAVRRKMGR